MQTRRGGLTREKLIHLGYRNVCFLFGDYETNVCCFFVTELFHTERSHVRALKILDQLFYQPMKEQQILPVDHLQLLFPNLDEMLEIHSQFNNNMKLKKKENVTVGDIGDILLKMVTTGGR